MNEDELQALVQRQRCQLENLRILEENGQLRATLEQYGIFFRNGSTR
jgi:hypothetical protein